MLLGLEPGPRPGRSALLGHMHLSNPGTLAADGISKRWARNMSYSAEVGRGCGRGYLPCLSCFVLTFLPA
jgi:hypothetical protein